ncbi:MAG: DedA family protein [Halobacteria archaeon]
MGFIAVFTDVVMNFLDQYGYIAVFIYMVLETSFILHFVPSEIVIPFMANRLVHGRLTFLLYVIVTTAGTVVGSLIIYFVLEYYGYNFIKNYGHIIHIPPGRLQKIREMFRNYGESSVMWGRLLPFVRALISAPAGLSSMDLRRFVVFTTVGSAVFNIAFTYIGYSPDHGVPETESMERAEENGSMLGEPSPGDNSGSFESAQTQPELALPSSSNGKVSENIDQFKPTEPLYMELGIELILFFSLLVFVIGVYWTKKERIRASSRYSTNLGRHVVQTFGFLIVVFFLESFLRMEGIFGILMEGLKHPEIFSKGVVYEKGLLLLTLFIAFVLLLLWDLYRLIRTVTES